MQRNTNVATEQAQGANKTLTETIRSLPRRALYCFSAALVLFGSHFIWLVITDEFPPSMLPPAGEVMEGVVPFRFAVVGDSRGNQAVFEEILARIRADDVSLILHTGDIVRRCSPRQFEWVLHELGEQNITVPFCAVPGNHDVNWEAEDARMRYRLYGRAFGPRRYWFAYANALFMALDTSTKCCSTQDLDWLDQTLARFRNQFEACFVYMHVPPRDPRPGRSCGLKEGAEDLIRVLNKHSVTAVFASHIHSCLEDKVAGVPVFITGGAGAERDEPILPYHYLLCTVGPGGSFTVQRKDVDDRINTDYPEYVFRVKFPNKAVVLGGVGLLFAGLVFSLRSLAGRPEETRH